MAPANKPATPRNQAAQTNLLRQGAEPWNAWRHRNPRAKLQLVAVQLVGARLAGVDLSDADLSGAVLVGADMPGSNLKRSKLAKSQIDSADLRGADLTGADLNEVSFTSSVLEECKFVDADLRSVDLTGAVLGRTVFGNADLRNARGLETVRHATPSILDFRTLQASGALPHAFLRGCGVPDRIIEYLPSLFGEAIRFYSVFLAYSDADAQFAERLHNDLQARGVRTWFAPHDLRIGSRISEAIDEAIRVYDKLLIVLSKTFSYESLG